MGRIFLTSDTHFNHLNITKFEPVSRPFETIEEMNEALVNNWNSVVSDEDTVYVVGDFFMGMLDKIDPILNRLKGKIILVRGNHDTPNRLKLYRERGIEIKDIEYIRYKGKFFILCHFPLANEEFKNMVRQDNSEIIICYGHIHSNAPTGYVDGTYHVGVDTNNLTPVALENIWKESVAEKTVEVEPPNYVGSPLIAEYIKTHTLPPKIRRDPPDGGFYG